MTNKSGWKARALAAEGALAGTEFRIQVVYTTDGFSASQFLTLKPNETKAVNMDMWHLTVNGPERITAPLQVGPYYRIYKRSPEPFVDQTDPEEQS